MPMASDSARCDDFEHLKERNNPSHDDKGALRESQLANRWQVSRRTLQRWREGGTGPAWLKINGTILYLLDDIHALERGRWRGDRS